MPLVVLVVLSVAAASALHAVTGGAELGDDAPRLLWMCLHPGVLFGDYRAAGPWDTWGSFPPLLPALFGLPIRPAAQLLSPFVAIRFGALVWTAACLLATASAARATGGAQGSSLRLVLLAFALLPPVWMAAAVLPQEEAYVALFALAIHRAAHARATRWVLPLFVATAFAGKYFLLILMLPVAVHLGRPLARLAVWVPVVMGLLVAWVGYHWLAHGLTPILSHNVDPDASISVWALLWNLGVQPPVALLKPGGWPVRVEPRTRAEPDRAHGSVPVGHAARALHLVSGVRDLGAAPDPVGEPGDGARRPAAGAGAAGCVGLRRAAGERRPRCRPCSGDVPRGRQGSGRRGRHPLVGS